MLFDDKQKDQDSQFVKSLKNYTLEILDECKRVHGPHLQIKELTWVINTQKTLNTYMRIFQEKYQSKISSGNDVKRLGNLQYNLLTKRQKDIPNDGKITSEYFYPKLIKSFAQHNKELADFWIS